jgi:hypothetical protein
MVTNIRKKMTAPKSRKGTKRTHNHAGLNESFGADGIPAMSPHTPPKA